MWFVAMDPMDANGPKCPFDCEYFEFDVGLIADSHTVRLANAFSLASRLIVRLIADHVDCVRLIDGVEQKIKQKHSILNCNVVDRVLYNVISE